MRWPSPAATAVGTSAVVADTGAGVAGTKGTAHASAKAMAGFGQHRVVHEARFFELAGSLAVEVQFIVSEEEARKLLEMLAAAKLRLFYAQTPAQFGFVEADPPADGP